MRDYRDIIAANIVSLRTGAGMTQSRLAQKLNYSDKAVSKWERGESIPDVAVLKQIADEFGVTVDYLLRSEHTPAEAPGDSSAKLCARNRKIITLLATSLVWLIATLLFVVLNLALKGVGFTTWLFYIYALPVSALVLLIFNSLWGRRRWNYLIISVMIWSLLLSVFLTVLLRTGLSEIWLVFVLGVPAQIIVILWSGLVKSNKRS